MPYLFPKFSFFITISIIFTLIHPSFQSPLTSTHTNHHIIFNPIGTIAAKMSYIHIAIPVNISSAQHQVSSFSSYLSRYKSLNTTHPNKLHFTRIINELATFAQKKLNKASQKLRFLDHVLPEDPSHQSRHRRFVDAIQLEICKETYHHQKVALANCNTHLQHFHTQLTLCKSQCSHLELSQIPYYSYIQETSPPPRQSRQFWIGKRDQCLSNSDFATADQAMCDRRTVLATTSLKTCLAILKTKHSDQTIFDNINPHRIAFSNESSTTTTPPPPTTTYAHYPFPDEPLPYHSTMPIRHTRQVFVAAAAVGGILGTFLGLFNNHEIDAIQHDLLNLSDQHNILDSVVQKHEHELATLHSELTTLTNTVETLIMYNPSLVYAILENSLDAVIDRIAVLYDTLQQLQHQRLAVSLLDENQLQVVFNAALSSAKALNVDLLPTKPQDLFQLDASYIRKGDEILILLHVPCTVTDEMLTLYEYVPFPYPLHQDPSKPIPAFDNIKSLQDLANSNHFPATSALFFKSDATMIAIGRNRNLQTASYRLITQADLAACIQKNHFYLCEAQQTLRKDLAGSCLGALYLQDVQGVQLHCRIDRRPLQETSYRLSSTRHIIYSPAPFTTQIQCNNGTHFPQKLQEITYIEVPALCSIELINSTISSVGNRRIYPDPMIFEWHIQPALLPVSLLTSASHLDSRLNELHSNLSSFRNSSSDNISDQQFTQLIHNHLATPSASSTIIWASLATSLTTVLIIIITFFIFLRRRRQLRPTLQPAQIPMSVIYNPPAPVYEDEISYIARTGNVVGSAAATRQTSRALPFQK